MWRTWREFLEPIFGGGNICQGKSIHQRWWRKSAYHLKCPPLVVGVLPLAWVGWTSYVVVVVDCTKFTTSRGSAIPYHEHFWVWIPMCKELAATLSISVLGTCSSTYVQAENADQAGDCNIGSLYQDHRMKRPVKCVKNFTSVISFQDQNWKNQAEKDWIWTDLGWTNLERNDLIGLSSKQKILILFVPWLNPLQKACLLSFTWETLRLNTTQFWS